jgi:hypothetical protein
VGQQLFPGAELAVLSRAEQHDLCPLEWSSISSWAFRLVGKSLMVVMKVAFVIVFFGAGLAALFLFQRVLRIVPLWVLSSMSGWRSLSSRFPEHESDPDSTTFRSCSVQLGGVGYGSCVDVLLSQKYVSLHIVWWCRDFHPNICIPRSQLKLGARTKMWWTEFRIEGEDTSIWFRKRIARELVKSPDDYRAGEGVCGRPSVICVAALAGVAVFCFVLLVPLPYAFFVSQEGLGMVELVVGSVLVVVGMASVAILLRMTVGRSH